MVGVRGAARDPETHHPHKPKADRSRRRVARKWIRAVAYLGPASWKPTVPGDRVGHTRTWRQNTGTVGHKEMEHRLACWCRRTRMEGVHVRSDPYGWEGT